MGLLLSDGFIREHYGKYFGIKLKKADKDVVLKVKKHLGYSGPIYYQKPETRIYPNGVTINSSGNVMLKICSAYTVDRLKSLGFSENKSLNEKFLDCIKDKDDEQICRNFIRGIFDGDGSIMFDKQRYSLCFQIVGPKGFLSDIQRYLIKYCNVRKTKLTQNIKGKDHFALRYRGNKQAIRILRWMYKDAGYLTRMDRKYKKFLLVKKGLAK